MKIEGKCRLRPQTDEDQSFLRKLYSTTRQAELAQVDWSEKQKTDFVDMQYVAQRQHYSQYYPHAEFDIIELENTPNIPIGRLYLDRRLDEIRIVDIAILPEYCGQGIGGMFLQKVLAEAEKNEIAVRIHVENFNPALRLYHRLGFRPIDTNGVYYLMEWSKSNEKN